MCQDRSSSSLCSASSASRMTRLRTRSSPPGPAWRAGDTRVTRRETDVRDKIRHYNKIPRTKSAEKALSRRGNGAGDGLRPADCHLTASVRSGICLMSDARGGTVK